MENPLLTEEQATDTLREISTHIQPGAIGDAFPLDGGVFLGVNEAGNDYRFANALNFLIKKKVHQNILSTKVFLLCIDPDFTNENIDRTINGLTIVHELDSANIRLVSSTRIPWSGSTMFAPGEEAAESNRPAANRVNNRRSNEPRVEEANSSRLASRVGSSSTEEGIYTNNDRLLSLLTYRSNRLFAGGASSGSLPPLYKITVTYRNPENGAERVFAIPVYFMRYALRSNYAESITPDLQSLLNIQLGRKTFQNYADSCNFQDRDDPIANFYKALFSFVNSESIQYIYFFSTAHSHNPSVAFQNSYIQPNASHDWWAHGYTRVTQPLRFGAPTPNDFMFPAGHVDNRFFQSLCEINSLLNLLIDQGSTVFFINIKNLETFQNPDGYNETSRLHPNYLNIPLGRSTRFYRNSERNLRFHRVRNDSFPPRLYRDTSGGKAKTKKAKQKRKTRKHRV